MLHDLLPLCLFIIFGFYFLTLLRVSGYIFGFKLHFISNFFAYFSVGSTAMLVLRMAFNPTL